MIATFAHSIPCALCSQPLLLPSRCIISIWLGVRLTSPKAIVDSGSTIFGIFAFVHDAGIDLKEISQTNVIYMVLNVCTRTQTHAHTLE